MQTTLRKTRESAPVFRIPETKPPDINAPTTKEIPYDYVARFPLMGKRGNRITQVINISTEGAFVAVEIAYSFIPAKLPDPTTGEKPLLRMRTFTNLLSASATDEANVSRLIQQCLLARLCGVDFLYSITDSGSGRELQNLPIHSIAGLGEATGSRPFRSLPKPVLFMPRSTIRIEIEEISEGLLYGYDDAKSNLRVGADLYIVLHGYKILGYGIG